MSPPLSGHALAGYPRNCPVAHENDVLYQVDGNNQVVFDTRFDLNGWIVDDFGLGGLTDVFDLNTRADLHHRDVIATYDECDMGLATPTTTYRINDFSATSTPVFSGPGSTAWLQNEPDKMYVAYNGHHCFIAECFMWNRILTTGERQALAAYLNTKWGLNVNA